MADSTELPVPGQSIRLRGVGPQHNHLYWDSDSLLRVGRTPNMEIVLEDSSVSRRHSEVVHTNEGWVVRDLGSTNGTLVNGIRVGRGGRRLRVDDVLQFGEVKLTVTQLCDGSPAAPDTIFGACQVTAVTEQSWDAAMDHLARAASGLAEPGAGVRALVRAQHAIYQVASLNELLHRCLDDALAKTRADYGAVVLTDRVSGRSGLAASRGTRPRDAAEQPFSQTLAQRCLKRGESLLCHESGAAVGVGENPGATGPANKSFVCALLRTPRQRLGILHLERGRGREPFELADLHLADALAANVSAAVENMQGVQERQRSVCVQTALALAQAVELRDPYTGGHAQRVTDYALLLAEQLKLSEAERQDLRLGAPLHDIGKIGIDDAVLRKNGPLTPAEFRDMQTHTVKGVAILQPIPELAAVLPLVRSHHERWDGKGYPDGLAGERIPFLARVLAVADTFDAMTTNRPYRAGLSLQQALAEIEGGASTQFDAECAASFLGLAGRLEELFQDRALTETFMADSLARQMRFVPELADAASSSRVCPAVKA